MSEWWTYRLSDFLLFSPETYYRLVASWHTSIWPAQLIGLALGVVLLIMAARTQGRTAGVIVAVALLFVGLGFEWRQFASINWFASYVAVALAIEAVLILLLALRKRVPVLVSINRRAVGYMMLALGVVIYPGIDAALGRGLPGAGVFATMRDPTVATTLGVLFLAASPRYLFAIPLLSSLYSAAMLRAMEAPEWWLPVVVALVAGSGLIAKQGLHGIPGNAPPSAASGRPLG